MAISSEKKLMIEELQKLLRIWGVDSKLFVCVCVFQPHSCTQKNT